MAWVALIVTAEEQRLKKINIKRRRMERELTQPLMLPDTEFIGRFRLSKANFERLCENIVPLLPTNERTNSGIKPTIKILAALNIYASGSYQGCVGGNDLLHLSQQSTSDCLCEVTEALNTPAILRKYIKFPQSQMERVSVAMRFNQKFGFPGDIGCIDGTHVAIVRPSNDEEVFYNRKGYHSLNVLVICDADLRFMHVDASFGGASHDSHVWNMCPVNPAMQRLHDEGQNFWLLGDSGYAQRPWMMTSILHTEANTPDASVLLHYTAIHVRTRNVIECTFGVLKSRFRCLLAHRTLHYKPRKAAQIVNACVVLHNFINDPNLEVDVEEISRDEEHQPPRAPAHLHRDERLIDRQGIVERFWCNRP